MLKWPTKSISALRNLFAPLQDIDIYVEDTRDEVFYSILFKRVADREIRIARIFGLGGKQAVIAAASAPPTRRPSLYIIDGDFEWVRGEDHPKFANIFRLEAYCIENYLICKRAIREILVQDLNIDENEANNIFNFSLWQKHIEETLVTLFIGFAAANHFDKSIPTISTGVRNLILKTKNKGIKKIDKSKAKKTFNIVINKIKSKIDDKSVNECIKSIERRVAKLPDPINIISGKDFLILMLFYSLCDLGCVLTQTNIRTRLAAGCDVARLSNLKKKMKGVASTKKF